GLPRVAEAGELPDRPGAAPIAGRVETPGVRELARPPDAVEPRITGPGGRAVDRLDRRAGQGGEVGVPLARGVVAPLPALASGGDVGCVHARHPRGIPERSLRPKSAVLLQ